MSLSFYVIFPQDDVMERINKELDKAENLIQMRLNETFCSRCFIDLKLSSKFQLYRELNTSN